MKNKQRKEQARAGGAGGELRPSRGASGDASASTAPGPAVPDGKSSFTGAALAVTAALIAISLFVYAPVRDYGFVELDDPLGVRENVHVAGGLTWDGVIWAFTSEHGGNWIPLTWLSHMLDVQLFGMNAGFHHLTNLLFHLANSVLLFWWLFRLTAALGRSSFVAALFAIHPLHVESVAWVTERKDVLSTLFLISALWAYTGYAKRRNWGRYLAALLLFVLGLMAKPMLVTLPFVLLLLDEWPLGRWSFVAPPPGRPSCGREIRGWTALGRLAREKLPFFAVAALSSVVALMMQEKGGALTSFDVTPLGLRVQNALVSYIVYIGRMAWPAGLAVLYPFPQSIPTWQSLGAAIILVAVSVLVIRAAARRPYLAVGWLWYLGTLVPALGLVRIGLQATADRYTYVPLIGLFIAVAWGAADLFERLPVLRRAAPVAASLAIAAFAIAARGQVPHWKDNAALFTREVEVLLKMDSYGAHLALGGILRDQGRMEEAIGHFNEAARLQPYSVDAKRSIGLALRVQGRNAEAAAALSEAARLRPDSAEVHYNLGLAQAGAGQIDEAARSFAEAAHLDPEFPEAHSSLGLALSNLGRIDEAIAQYREALRLKPDFAEVHNNMGTLLAGQGKIEESLPSFMQAVQLKPDFELAHINLGAALAKTGRISEAIAEFQQALRINPGNEKVRGFMAALSQSSRGK